MSSLKCYIFQPVENNLWNDLIEKSFELWSTVWSIEARKLEVSNIWDRCYFFRQKSILSLEYNGEIVATCLSNQASLQSAETGRYQYLEKLKPNMLDALIKQKYSQVSTLEALAVKPSVNYKPNNKSLGQLMCAIAVNYFVDERTDAAITSVRTDKKVHHTLEELDFETLVADVEQFNTRCNLVALKRDNARRVSCSHLQSIWSERLDYRI